MKLKTKSGKEMTVDEFKAHLKAAAKPQATVQPEPEDIPWTRVNEPPAPPVRVIH
jgi:hypothetical protein